VTAEEVAIQAARWLLVSPLRDTLVSILFGGLAGASVNLAYQVWRARRERDNTVRAMLAEALLNRRVAEYNMWAADRGMRVNFLNFRGSATERAVQHELVSLRAETIAMCIQYLTAVDYTNLEIETAKRPMIAALVAERMIKRMGRLCAGDRDKEDAELTTVRECIEGMIQHLVEAYPREVRGVDLELVRAGPVGEESSREPAIGGENPDR